MNSSHRMPSNNRRDKDSDKKREKAKKHMKAPKKGGHGNGHDSNDDSDVDSHGNIRGLIDYEYTDESYTSSEEESSSDSSPPPRRSAQIARKRIQKELKKESKKPRNVVVESSSSSSESSEDEQPIRRHRAAKKSEPEKKSGSGRRSKKVVESETESDDDSDSDFKDFMNDDDEEDEDDEEEDDDDEDEEEPDILGGGNLILALGGGGGYAEDDRMVPQRHNMKKESASVKKFVKLVTAPIEDNTIDAQIDQFKALPENSQKQLLIALEKRPTITDTGVNLMLRILTMKLAPDVQAMVLSKYNALQGMDSSTGEYFKLRNWLDKVVSVPYGMYKELPIKIEDGQDACTDFMQKARKSLDDAIYGQDETKLQIMQYMSTKISNPSGRGLSLLLVGPPGIGKTSLIKNGIAKALGWPFQFISLGGDSDASTYSGHQLVYESSHCGKIVNSLINAKSMSMILLFDEIDKISATPKGEEVQNLLVHLTDPTAHGEFEDKYLAGVPIDLSRVMFIFSANDISKIDKVLLDRLMVIELKGYDTAQKITIAENYLLPTALKEVNLVERIAISRDVIKYIIETHAPGETGVRDLKRCIEQIAQKVNMLRMYNSKDLPFHIPNFSLPFVVKKEHIDLFIKKKEVKETVPFGMYT